MSFDFSPNYGSIYLVFVHNKEMYFLIVLAVLGSYLKSK